MAPFEIHDYGDDGRTQVDDAEIRHEADKEPAWIFKLQYCHAILGGFRPARWQDFQVPTLIDIRLPH
jgi:hypothetical protein